MGVKRPSMQFVQRSLIIGVLIGAILGCTVGLSYAWMINPATYAGGAIPSEWAANYKTDYITNLVVDSYIVNRNVDTAKTRLGSFSVPEKIQALGERVVIFSANGQAVEAQAVNELAAKLKVAEGWDNKTVESVVANLSNKYRADNAKAEAINEFSSQMLGGQIPQQVTGNGQAVPPPAQQPAADDGGGFSFWKLLIYCVVIIIIGVVGFLLFSRFKGAKEKPAPTIEETWEGAGPAPIKQWAGTYTLGQDNYDEFFTIETESGDFLGESGVGILETKPGTSPKQAISFDVGLFDKTDITTLSRVVMSDFAYNNEASRAKIDINPQAEAILAESGKEFTLETSAMRIVAKILELEYDADRVYFKKLKMTLDVFIRDGADLRIGSMDVPDQFK